ncbi:MAG: DUF362 domain-containing protein [Treponema sp.]|jgi:uncharacterized protein (DUF362 family)|nr:DUF362 domain-containing protein [Treponema sp.]
MELMEHPAPQEKRTGNEILVIYGDKPEAMAFRLAEAAGLAERIGDRHKSVGLKPNVVLAWPAAEGATTHPEIARGLIRYLQQHGFTRLSILEGSWVGARTEEAFTRCGYRKLAADTGVLLKDTQQDHSRTYDCRGMDLAICDSALAVDFMINLPVLKGHCQTLLTCALKNNKGLIPNQEKRRFHTLGLHKPIAHLNTRVRNDFILVDGICGDLDFEEGGNPVPAGRMAAAFDPVLIDAWAASQLGYTPEEIPYLGMAEHLGIGTTDLSRALIRELSAPVLVAGKLFQPGLKVKQLAPFIQEDRACSACYAALVFALSRMHERERQRLPGPIGIGQGFKGKRGGLGVGHCTSGFTASIPGCPPGAVGVLDFLRKQLNAPGG